ncbi:MAG: nucleotidyltransferase family protein [Bacteroidales bacterium]|nr:nucleotidyltransferase family protein [Bacteroidales bacterium]
MKILKEHKPELLKFGIRYVGLFGSYSREEPYGNSDIDILIDFEPGQDSFDNYMAVYDLLEELFKNQKVEVVTKNGLSPYIGPQVLNELIYA